MAKKKIPHVVTQFVRLFWNPAVGDSVFIRTPGVPKLKTTIAGLVGDGTFSVHHRRCRGRLFLPYEVNWTPDLVDHAWVLAKLTELFPYFKARPNGTFITAVPSIGGVIPIEGTAEEILQKIIEFRELDQRINDAVNKILNDMPKPGVVFAETS